VTIDSIDVVKDFWDQRPCNVRHSKAEIGTMEYFEEVDLRRYYVEPHIKNFADFDKYRGQRVLELGCGIGTDAIRFAKSGAIYTGVELSPNSLDIAKNRFKTYGLKGNLCIANVENVGDCFNKGDFDLIYSFGVLHHTPSIEKALESISSISTKSTEIKIMVYAKNSWKAAMINAGLDQPEAQYGCPIANTYSEQDISELFDNANLELTSISQDHIFPYVVEDYKNFVYRKQPYFESMPDEVFNALKTHFGWHLMVHGKGK
jgi:ubiquinone/menaquinone biosynthesis C-methylase UbiE